MKTHWLEKPLKYDGTQLKHLWAYLNFGILGDSIVAFQGPCDISFEHMVDGEDLNAKAEIRGSHMLHFIIEKFDVSLFAMVAVQRLTTAIAKDLLQEMSPKAYELRREGDDLFLNEKKLSISIATLSNMSAMMHFALNISNNGTPVPTLSLEDLGVKPEAFAKHLMDKLSLEIQSILDATRKVRAVL